MTSPASTDLPGAPPGTSVPGARIALAAMRARLAAHWWRTGLFMTVLCTLIALVITAIDGSGLRYKLVYSFAIGITCLAAVSGTRLLAAVLHDRLRRRRGLPPDADSFDGGWSGVAPGMLLAVLVGPPLGLGIGDLLTGLTSPSLLDFGAGATRITLVMAVVGTLAAVAVLSLQERLAAARAAAEAAERQSTAARLALLQSQLEPHMLFNTLANLRVLIGLDPPRAQQMLDHLIAFLRTTLAASQAPRHALEREFQWLDDYLALMKVRMGERLEVRLALPPALAALPVPPLVLQPLVENAVRHGVEPRPGPCRIEVSAAREGAMLVLAVRDTGVGLSQAPAREPPPPSATRAGGGFGLRQVRERLATLYGAAASLHLEEAPGPEGGTLAVLRLPLETAGEAPAAAAPPTTSP